MQSEQDGSLISLISKHQITEAIQFLQGKEHSCASKCLICLKKVIPDLSDEQLTDSLGLFCLLLSQGLSDELQISTLSAIVEALIRKTSCKYTFIVYRSHISTLTPFRQLKYFRVLNQFVPLVKTNIIVDINEVLQGITEAQKNALPQEETQMKRLATQIRKEFLNGIIDCCKLQSSISKEQEFIALTRGLLNLDAVQPDKQEITRIYLKETVNLLLSVITIRTSTALPFLFLSSLLRSRTLTFKSKFILVIRSVEKYFPKQGLSVRVSNHQINALSQIVLFFCTAVEQESVKHVLGIQLDLVCSTICKFVILAHSIEGQIRQAILNLMSRSDWLHILQMEQVYRHGVMDDNVQLRCYFLPHYRRMLKQNVVIWRRGQTILSTLLKQMQPKSSIDYIGHLRSFLYYWINIGRKMQRRGSRFEAEAAEFVRYFMELKPALEQKANLQSFQKERGQILLCLFGIEELLEIM